MNKKSLSYCTMSMGNEQEELKLLYYEYGQCCRYVYMYIFVRVPVCVYMCRHIHVYEHDYFMYVHMRI